MALRRMRDTGVAVYFLGMALFLNSCAKSPSSALNTEPIGGPDAVIVRYAIAQDSVRERVGVDPTVTRVGSYASGRGLLFWARPYHTKSSEYRLRGERGEGILLIGYENRRGAWDAVKLDFEGKSLLTKPRDVD